MRVRIIHTAALAALLMGSAIPNFAQQDPGQREAKREQSAGRPSGETPEQGQAAGNTEGRAAAMESGQRESVRRIQEKLQQLGYYDGEVDGILGEKTEEALAEALDQVKPSPSSQTRPKQGEPQRRP